MLTSNLEIGERLSVEMLEGEERKGLIYSSQLLDVSDSFNMEISCPMHKARYVMLENDSDVRIQYHHHGEHVESFIANIISKEMKEGILSIKIKRTSNVERIQRRKFYRLSCCLDIKYCWQLPLSKTSDDLGIITRSTYKKGLTKNLSGNGVCIVTNEELPLGTDIQMEIFTKSAPFKLKSTVIRSSKMSEINENKYEIGAVFCDISPGYQDKVIKYIFNEQRQLLSKI